MTQESWDHFLGCRDELMRLVELLIECMGLGHTRAEATVAADWPYLQPAWAGGQVDGLTATQEGSE